MSIVTDPVPNSNPIAVGIDTHAEVHVAAVIDHVGRELGDRGFATTPAGYRELQAWVEAFGTPTVIGIEGTGSYGAGVARHLAGGDAAIVEVDRPDRKARRLEGKSDARDAYAAARAALSGRATGIPKSRDGNVEMIRVLRVARSSAVKARAAAIIQLKAIIQTAPDPAPRRTPHHHRQSPDHPMRPAAPQPGARTSTPTLRETRTRTRPPRRRHRRHQVRAVSSRATDPGTLRRDRRTRSRPRPTRHRNSTHPGR